VATPLPPVAEEVVGAGQPGRAPPLPAHAAADRLSRSSDRGGRRQLAGGPAVAAALAEGAPLRLVLLRRGAPAAARALARRARELGVAVREASANDLRRMSGVDPPADLVGLVGPDPAAPVESVLAAGGAAWLLAGVAYAGNAGAAIRTAEVSGADAIFLDAAFDGAARRRALRASMHAERFFPVHWTAAGAAIDAARAAGRRVLAVEDVGALAPWQVDLRGPLLLVIGGEGRGIPAPVLARCDDALRVPMQGFIPCYNLQAAMAAVAAERLRQLGA
jgi:23S rRNA (guanosine2251-2'-O)-methyltransferase